MFKNKRYKKSRLKKIYKKIFFVVAITICLVLIVLFIIDNNNNANIRSSNEKVYIPCDSKELTHNLCKDKSDIGYLKNRVFNTVNNFDLIDSLAQDFDLAYEKTKNNYDYSKEVPVKEEVDDSYFDDAVFIGNSQVEGIKIYKAMGNTTVYAGKGIMANTIFTKKIIRNNDSKITIMDALKERDFGKVYIMLGANELGWAFPEVFVEKYSEVIDKIKELQPNAIIYINTIIPVSKSRSKRDNIYNNKNITKYNILIRKIAQDKKVHFIETKNVFGTDEGCLPEKAGTDGIHFYGTYYEDWFNYLKKHTI